MARVEVDTSVVGSWRLSWNNCFEQKSTKMARWSLLVTQLNGAYPMALIVVIIDGEQ
jgi:hypothetical protein